MKKIFKLLPVMLAITLVSCQQSKPSSNIILPTDAINNVINATEGSVYLNLTSIGLYNGSKGQELSESKLENVVVIANASVGDTLPTTITSTTPQVVFHSWCYYDGTSGLPLYTSTVVKDINLYHATFKYDSTIVNPTTPTPTTPTPTTPTPTTPTVTTPIPTTPVESTPVPTTPISTPTSTPLPTSEVTYYFIDKAWWNQYSASSFIYLFNSGSHEYREEWPGIMMNHLGWNETTGKNLWSFTVDLSKYDTAVINRRSGDGSEPWNSQTVDITLTKENNTIELCDEEMWGESHATVTMSYQTYTTTGGGE